MINLSTLEWERVKIGDGTDEYVNTGTGAWLREPEENVFQGVVNSIEANLALIQHESVEASALKKVLMRSSFNYQLPASEDNPLLTPEQAKNQWDVDIDVPTTRHKVMLMSNMKKGIEADRARAGKYLSWDTKLAAIAGFATLGIALSLTPTALALGLGIGSVIPFVGSAVGATAAGAFNFASKWRTLAKLANAARRSAAASRLGVAVTRPGLQKATKILIRNIRKPAVTGFCPWCCGSR